MRERNEYNRAFAEQLRRVSGCDVWLLLDERSKAEPSDVPGLVSLHQKNYDDLGLYAPPDAAWRCGDYGLYLAYNKDPSRDYYWVIEDDVRIAGDAAAFFRLCQTSSADFLAAHLRPTVRGNFWWPHTMSRDAEAFACLFCAVRLSNRAVAASFQKRQEHSSNPFRRALWPNDEGLVATTVASSGFSSADFNELRRGLWNASTYSVTARPVTKVRQAGAPELIHPVRFKERSREHIRQTGWEDASSLAYRVKRRIVRAANAYQAW